jgi:hypothetical protein
MTEFGFCHGTILKLLNVVLSSHILLTIAPVVLYLVTLMASWMTGWSKLGPSVKSRIVLTEPRMGTVNVAELLNARIPWTPTYGSSEPCVVLCTGASGLPIVELTSSIASVPLGSPD